MVHAFQHARSCGINIGQVITEPSDTVIRKAPAKEPGFQHWRSIPSTVGDLYSDSTHLATKLFSDVLAGICALWWANFTRLLGRLHTNDTLNC